MRFVAGQGAVAEQLPVGTVAKLLLAVKSDSTIGKITWQRCKHGGAAAGCL
ncbi:MAG: hypothetical protein PUC92_04995 [bacterium]|nr:hypothetical protein [bacterium]